MIKTQNIMKTAAIFLFLTLPVTLSAASEQTEKASNLLDKVRSDISAIYAEFRQQEIDINGMESEESSGKMWLQSPNQFRWEYIEPGPQLIIANGEQVWIYDEDLEQVTIKPQNSAANPIYVLLDKERTEKNYIIAMADELADANNSLQWVTMLPKVESDEIQKIWLGISTDNNIKVLKMKNRMDNTVIFTFSNIKRNPEIKTDLFNFIIPEGTDILSENTGFAESDY